MATCFGKCEHCHHPKPVIAHDPPILGMVWLCLRCGALLKVRERLKTEVRK